MSKYIEIAPTTTTLFTYDEAWLYCATLTLDNNYDWRMPTIRDMDDSIDGWLDEEKDDYVLWPQRVTPVRDV